MEAQARNHLQRQFVEIRNGPLLLRSKCADVVLGVLLRDERIDYILNECTQFVDRFEVRTNIRHITATKRPLMQCRITQADLIAPLRHQPLIGPASRGENRVAILVDEFSPVPLQSGSQPDTEMQGPVVQSKRQRRRLKGKNQK